MGPWVSQEQRRSRRNSLFWEFNFSFRKKDDTEILFVVAELCTVLHWLLMDIYRDPPGRHHTANHCKAYKDYAITRIYLKSWLKFSHESILIKKEILSVDKQSSSIYVKHILYLAVWALKTSDDNHKRDVFSKS